MPTGTRGIYANGEWESNDKLSPGSGEAHLDTTTPAEGSRPTRETAPCRPRALTRRASNTPKMVVMSRCARSGAPVSDPTRGRRKRNIQHRTPNIQHPKLQTAHERRSLGVGCSPVGNGPG